LVRLRRSFSVGSWTLVPGVEEGWEGDDDEESLADIVLGIVSILRPCREISGSVIQSIGRFPGYAMLLH
jgi:hypothetical protein